MYFNLNDLKNLEKELIAKESQKDSNIDKNILFHNKLNNVFKNGSTELNSAESVNNNLSELNSNKVLPDIDLKDNSSLSTKEWIAKHQNLILKACNKKSSFEELIDEIAKYSSSIKKRRILYEDIEHSWNNENIFGATILDDGTIIPCRVERFDF